MFIDYVALLLVNMAAAFLTLAAFFVWGLRQPDQRKWAPAFAIVGVVALLNGLHMIWTWPLPGAYGSIFGEMSVMLGALFLGASLACGCGWDLRVLGIYAVMAGIAAIVLGARIMDLGLTAAPRLSGVGFILSGLAGVLTGPALALRQNRALARLAAVALALAALLWAFTGYMAYWSHAQAFAKWRPAAAQMLPPPPAEPAR
jgi:putative membrane protein